MDDIHTEDQRNTQTALLDGDALHLADRLRALEVKQTAYPALPDILGDIALACSAGDDIAGNGQVELSEFFLERHLRHELINKAVHLGVFVATRGAARERERCR